MYTVRAERTRENVRVEQALASMVAKEVLLRSAADALRALPSGMEATSWLPAPLGLLRTPRNPIVFLPVFAKIIT